MTDDHLATLLALDAIVLHEYWASVLDAVRDAACAGRTAADVRTIVDLGSGTGTGAIGLAARFPGAEVIAVDSSPDMVARLRANGASALLADLDEGWPAITDVDVTFASMSLHHLADPERVLRELFAATRPGGVVAAAEFRDPLRVLPPGYGRDLEERTMATLRAGHPLPELQADWPTRLRAAGFDAVTETSYDIDLPAPVSDDARRYAQGWLSRLRHAGEDRLDPADLAALDEALADVGAYHLHGRRTLVIGRRAG